MTIAVALLLLAALAGTITYTGYLVVGVLADYLATSRFLAGLLLACLFARFPWVSNGKARMAGLLPQPLRRPVMLGLLALCLLRFLTQGETVSALFAAFSIAFILGWSWLKHRLLGRMASSIGKFSAGRDTRVAADPSVIDGEFRERKE